MQGACSLSPIHEYLQDTRVACNEYNNTGFYGEIRKKYPRIITEYPFLTSPLGVHFYKISFKTPSHTPILGARYGMQHNVGLIFKVSRWFSMLCITLLWSTFVSDNFKILSYNIKLESWHDLLSQSYNKVVKCNL